MKKLLYLMLVSAWLTSCAANSNAPENIYTPVGYPTQTENAATPTFEPAPTRPVYQPGELVSYTAQSGDTLPSLAGRFNTTIEEILDANPIIPADASTLPEGLPMEIPIYYRSFWGSPLKIIPNHQFVNGPAMIDFDTKLFINSHPGWLKNYQEYAAGENRTGPEIINYVAENFSVSPKLLIGIIEFQSQGISNPLLSSNYLTYPLGYRNANYRGLYLQLVWAANTMNNGYYGWRSGDLFEFEDQSGATTRPDPWQNAASVGVQYLFNELLSPPEFNTAIAPSGFQTTYAHLFGDPWEIDMHPIPGSLVQPEFSLPFETGKTWAFTGGPHTGWGTGAPFAALDFAPPSEQTGCYESNDWVTAIAGGVIVRSEFGLAVLDVDGDGDERTGWVIIYLHIDQRNKAKVGDVVTKGQPIGHPSCDGGTSTGTHIHLARKYNGEWMLADGPLPFVMEGWIPVAGNAAYQGSLTRFGDSVIACECATQDTFIQSSGSLIP